MEERDRKGVSGCGGRCRVVVFGLGLGREGKGLSERRFYAQPAREPERGGLVGSFKSPSRWR